MKIYRWKSTERFTVGLVTPNRAYDVFNLYNIAKNVSLPLNYHSGDTHATPVVWIFLMSTNTAFRFFLHHCSCKSDTLLITSSEMARDRLSLYAAVHDHCFRVDKTSRNWFLPATKIEKNTFSHTTREHTAPCRWMWFAENLPCRVILSRDYALTW